MNKYMVYVPVRNKIPKVDIEATSEMNAKGEYVKRYAPKYVFSYYDVVARLIDPVIEPTDYAARLDNWRKAHEGKKWTGTKTVKELDEDQLRYWFECYVKQTWSGVTPIKAIRAMYSEVKKDQREGWNPPVDEPSMYAMRLAVQDYSNTVRDRGGVLPDNAVKVLYDMIINGEL